MTSKSLPSPPSPYTTEAYDSLGGESWLRKTRLLGDFHSKTAFSDLLLKPFVRAGGKNFASNTLDAVFSYRKFWLARHRDRVVGRIAVFARQDDDATLYTDWNNLPHSGLFQEPSSPTPFPHIVAEQLLDEPPPPPSKQRRAFFGFFYIEEQHPLAGQLLLETAFNTVKNDGYDHLQGPVSLHPLLGAGIFNTPNHTKPLLHQPQNQATQTALREFAITSSFIIEPNYIRTWGWRKNCDSPALVRKIALSTKVHQGLTLKHFNPNRRRHLEALVSIYNDAYQHTPDYLPLTFPEVKWAFSDFGLVNPTCSYLAVLDSEPIGLILATENLKSPEMQRAEEVFAQLPKRIYHNLIGKKPPLRILSFAVRQAYRGAAVGGLPMTLWYEMLTSAIDSGYEHIITPAIDVRDFYHVNMAKLLKLRPEMTLTQFTGLFLTP